MIKLTHEGLSIVLKTSSGEIELIWLTSATITLNDSRNEEIKTADVITKKYNVEIIDIHIMCLENHIDIFVDNLKLIGSISIDESINEHVMEVKIESFDDIIENIGYDIVGYDPKTTFEAPDLSPFMKIGCRNESVHGCARLVDGYYDFMQVYTNQDSTEVYYSYSC